jgi:hypothetical protein
MTKLTAFLKTVKSNAQKAAAKKKNLKKKSKKKNKKMAKGPGMSPFGAISAIDTAPVAIGNSVRGTAAQIIQSKNGVTVRSRDFMFPATGTGSVQTWTLAGGTPITPAVFSDSTLRQYMQMYQKYRWKYLCVHYITSSATTATGDVMFYHQKNRESVFLNQTSSQLLPFVLNDDDTVIGPQWTNHSAPLHITGRWKSTDYGMTSELEQYADGDLFLLSKTTTTDSPGYVLFDYEVEFSEQQISPRLLALPLPRAQWYNLNLRQSGVVATANVTVPAFTVAGNNLTGLTSTNPAGIANGDVYKVILDITNSTAPVNTTLDTVLVNSEPYGYVPFTVQDGTTLYAVYNGLNYVFFSNPEAAYTSFTSIRYGTTANLTVNFQCWISLIGTIGSTNFNPNF